MPQPAIDPPSAPPARSLARAGWAPAAAVGNLRFCDVDGVDEPRCQTIAQGRRPDGMKTLRVFPRRTRSTPDDEDVRTWPPDLFDEAAGEPNHVYSFNTIETEY